MEDKTRQTHDNPRNVDVQIQDEVVRKSPHGYGNYPEIPDDFPSNIRIPWLLADGKYNENGHSSILELNARVLIKLWESGDTQLTGGDITEDLKVYPHYPNTAYVTYRDDVLDDGSIRKMIASVSGGPELPEITLDMMITGNIPGVTLIDANQSGIDVFQFLNLE